jgi:hypothetical protein
VKPRYTVAKPPRVHEVAKAVHWASKDMMNFLRYKYGLTILSASSPVPLPVAIDLVNNVWRERSAPQRHITLAGTQADGTIGADCSCGWSVRIDSLTYAAEHANLHLTLSNNRESQ